MVMYYFHTNLSAKHLDVSAAALDTGKLLWCTGAAEQTDRKQIKAWHLSDDAEPQRGGGGVFESCSRTQSAGVTLLLMKSRDPHSATSRFVSAYLRHLQSKQKQPEGLVCRDKKHACSEVN